MKKLDPNVLTIAGEKIQRGERKSLQLECAALYDYTKLEIPVEVIRGKKPGPVLFISAAIHGDEINGVEIIRRLLGKSFLTKIRGTLILVPIVNVFGFNNKSRYLPDRRDLNRSFPGSATGSLASRLAQTFMKEIVSISSYGIDLHTGAQHRTNLPQIRACLEDPETLRLARSFEVPVIINSKLRDGSLREAARKKNVAMLLFEGGEALRFEDKIIARGLTGCISVMRKIGMLEKALAHPKKTKIFVAKSSSWLRAPRSGAFTTSKKVGDKIHAGDVLATIANPFGREAIEVRAHIGGILIGANLLPLVNRGDPIFHIAAFRNANQVESELERISESEI